jgi:hypothetical protein
VLGDAVAQLGHVNAQLLEDLMRKAWVLEEGEEDVLHVPLAVPLLSHELLAGCQHLLGLLGEPVLSHHGEYTSDFSLGP